MNTTYKIETVDAEYIRETFELVLVQVIGNPKEYFGLLAKDGTIIRGCWLGDMADDNPIPKIKLPLNTPLQLVFYKYIHGVGYRTLEEVNVLSVGEK